MVHVTGNITFLNLLELWHCQMTEMLCQMDVEWSDSPHRGSPEMWLTIYTHIQSNDLCRTQDTCSRRRSVAHNLGFSESQSLMTMSSIVRDLITKPVNDSLKWFQNIQQWEIYYESILLPTCLQDQLIQFRSRVSSDRDCSLVQSTVEYPTGWPDLLSNLNRAWK